ncbi:MAG: NAD(P)H-quinone oxidoreductase subunit 3 [Planctomycetes bacterium]|nr:NAD(P)H-quinone oxidoreductase subunit 3 [Planctomycetota bacterium]
MATPTAIVAYLALFAAVAAVFLFANLVIGRLTRPNLPSEEKLEVYECGEPTIGSSFVQFDLRFYVIALLFIIFDVEIAFFFPWATVFGKSVELTSPNMAIVATEADGSEKLSPVAVNRLQELGVTNPQLPVVAEGGLTAGEVLQGTAKKIALTSFADIGVFFAVLLVGFAYVWRRGDLDWVRTVSSQRGEVVPRAPPHSSEPPTRAAGSILSPTSF